MKKLFLSLSILTIAFSAQAEFMPKNYFNNSGVKSEALYRKLALSAARLASNAKVAVVAAPAAVVAGGLYALDRAQAKQAELKQAELNRQSEKLAKAKMIGAQMAEEKANIQAGVALQSKGFRGVKNAISNFGSSVANTRVAQSLVNAGSSVKTQVLAHSRIATGAGLATIAGLSYVAYKNFGKATAKKVVETKKPEVKAVKAAAPVVSKRKKAHKGLPGGYARRR